MKLTFHYRPIERRASYAHDARHMRGVLAVHGIDAGKSAELRALGFDPRVGVAVNLAFSFIGSVMFIVALLRSIRRVCH